MPLIEFWCDKCNKKFEDLVFKRSEIRSMHCPVCKGIKVRRLFSTFGFIGKAAATGSSSANSCTSCARPSCAGCAG